MGEFYGIHEDNDPTKRLMVVINYNMDIGDYMEWSPTGVYAIAPDERSLQVRDQLRDLRADALDTIARPDIGLHHQQRGQGSRASPSPG